jgi:hypothetical protein
LGASPSLSRRNTPTDTFPDSPNFSV